MGGNPLATELTRGVRSWNASWQPSSASPANRLRWSDACGSKSTLEATVPPLVLVSAPPGFGKSTLLVQWLTGWPGGVGWLSLDAGDNDPVLFLRGLLMAARSIADETGALVPGLAPLADSSEAGPARIIAEIVDLLVGASRPSVIVLDDYHVITSSVVHEAVALLAGRLPAGAHLAIATRADPPLPLARLRARGELLEIRADALRFSSDEAAQLLRSQFDVGLDRSDADWLVEQTEGWAAAIQLAGLSLRGRPNASEAVRRFGAGHRFILDFVAEEVLAGLPPSTFDFLLRTSVLERLTGPLCDTVANRGDEEGETTSPAAMAGPGGQAMLEGLERANLFVVPLDDERRWYRYHHLFADLLRARLALLHPDWLPSLHERAAIWLEAHGLIDDAVRHALASEDGAAARGMIRRHWLAAIHAGEIETVDRWVTALPEAIVRPDPQLNAIRAWLPVLRGKGESVDEHIRAAEVALATGAPGIDPDDIEVVPVQLACIRSHLARFAGDAVAAEAFAVTARTLVPDSLPRVPRAILLGDATILIAYARLLGGNSAGAVAALREARPLLVEGGNLIAASRATARLARIRTPAGEPRRRRRAVCRGDCRGRRLGPVRAARSCHPSCRAGRGDPRPRRHRRESGGGHPGPCAGPCRWRRGGTRGGARRPRAHRGNDRRRKRAGPPRAPTGFPERA